MRLHICWVLGVIVAVILSGAAFADATVRNLNNPIAVIGGQMAMLLGAEWSLPDAYSEQKSNKLVAAPKAATKISVAKKPARAVVVKYDAAWLAGLPAPTGDAEWECLRKAIYFEARGETLKGQFAVAEVILNRKDSGQYPASVCGVVGQRGNNGGCQFSYVCDGRADAMRDGEAIDRAGRIARVMLDGAPRTLTTGAIYFHTRGVSPYWSHHFDRTASIGAHLFYKP